MARILIIINLEEGNTMQNFLKKGHNFSEIARLLERSTISLEYKNLACKKTIISS